MNKNLKVLFSLLIMTLIFSPGIQSNSVEAASKYADGEYSLPFTVLKDKTDEQSVTNDYMESPAKLVVQGGKNYVEVTLKNKSWWQYFKVQTGGNFAEVTILSEGDDTQLVRFEVENPDQVVNAKVHIIVPDINYDNKYDINFKFDTSKVSTEKATATSGTSEEVKGEGAPSKGQKEETSSKGQESGITEPEKNPKTGDNTPILLLSLVLLASGFIVVRRIAFK